MKHSELPDFFICCKMWRAEHNSRRLRSVGKENNYGGETMANKKNLIPGGHKLTHEEQSKGGKASGEARRLRSAVKRMLEIGLPDDMQELKKALKKAGINTTNDNGIAFAMVLKALNGDTAAASWIRDTAGEKPKDEVAIEGDAVVIISGDDKLAE